MQDDVIAKEQRFLEELDRRQSECNLVMLGVPGTGETLDGATTDVEISLKG